MFCRNRYSSVAQAVAIADCAQTHVLGLLTPGLTPRTLVSELERLPELGIQSEVRTISTRIEGGRAFQRARDIQSP